MTKTTKKNYTLEDVQTGYKQGYNDAIAKMRKLIMPETSQNDMSDQDLTKIYEEYYNSPDSWHDIHDPYVVDNDTEEEESKSNLKQEELKYAKN